MLRIDHTFFVSALFVALLFGCSTKSHIGGDDAGGESCGPSTCAAGEVCCNESCGICTEPGGSCIEIACTDGGGGGEPCGSVTCPAGEVCCSESCGICTPPGGGCPAVECLDGGMPDGGEACGPVTCGAGEVCCNASCGICTAPGEDCAAIACVDAGPTTCGGFRGEECPDGSYCDYPDGCGFADGTGTCAPRPEGCMEDCPGVCGCDGRDYCNGCIAAAAGVDVQHFGTCGGTTMCTAMDARGVGPCTLFLGFIWDGTSCVGIGGCTCEGTDCSRLYPGPEVCERAHAACDRPPPPPPTDCSSLGQIECVDRFECEWVTEDGFPGPISYCRDAGPTP